MCFCVNMGEGIYEWIKQRMDTSSKKKREKGKNMRKNRTYLQQLHRLAISHLGLSPVHVEVQFARVDALLGRHRQPPILRRVVTRRPEVRARARHPQNLIFLPRAIHNSDTNLGGGRVRDVVERDFLVPGGGDVIDLREGGREGGRAVSVLSTSFSCQLIITTK